VKNRINNQYDFLLVIVGKVGDGKSMLECLSCAFVDNELGNKFTVERVIFTALEYKAHERKLRSKLSIGFDEGEEIFFSRRAMERSQKDMILKFAQIRQKNHFIVICTPSLALLETWLRGIGVETRVNAIWRVVRRGMFYVYSARTGSMQKIRIDRNTNTIKYPEPDYVGFWKEIKKSEKFWQEYLKKKNDFLTMNKESNKVSREREKVMKKIGESMTVRDLMELHNVSEGTVKAWIMKYKVFPKRSIFIDFSGKYRIKFKGYQEGMRKLERLKQKQVLMKSEIERKRLEKLQEKVRRMKVKPSTVL
jgi:hypothetical protein